MAAWSVLAVSIFAFGMGLFFALAGYSSPSADSAAIPASLAFSAIGMLGGAVFGVLKDQEGRLRKLEERDRELNRGPAKRAAASERPPK